MSLEQLKTARARVIGTKQTAKAVEKGQATLVYIARDAEEFVIRDVLRACRERNIETLYVETMAALGKACGIEVGAATAAIIKT